MLFEISVHYPLNITFGFFFFINCSRDEETDYSLGSLVIHLYSYISQKNSGKLSGHTQLPFHLRSTEAKYLLNSCDLMGTRIIIYIQTH